MYVCFPSCLEQRIYKEKKLKAKCFHPYTRGPGVAITVLMCTITGYSRRIAVIAVAPTGKASFVYNYVQTRLKAQYNGKRSFSLVYVLKLLITAIRAVGSLFR